MMKLIYKNLILTFAIILISTIGVFAQKDDDKPKDDGPKIKINPKPDEKPRPTPKPDDSNKPKKPSSILIDTRKGDFENGILKILIG